MNSNVLLIVPCFNEEQRLPLQTLIEAPNFIQYLLADDGSTDATLSRFQEIQRARPNTLIFKAPQNQGKANVIQAAYQWWSAQQQTQTPTWIGFWDADLATPLSEVEKFLIYQNQFSPASQVITGCRLARYGAQIQRNPIRHYLSRVFVTFTDLLLGMKAYDSQCGAKLFTPTMAKIAFAAPFVSKWVFDVEILLRVDTRNVLEVPVFNWSEIPGSKMRLGRESLRVLRDLFKIRKIYRQKL